MRKVVPFEFSYYHEMLGNDWTLGSSHFVFLDFDQSKSFGNESNKDKEVNWAWATSQCSPARHIWHKATSTRIGPRPPPIWAARPTRESNPARALDAVRPHRPCHLRPNHRSPWVLTAPRFSTPTCAPMCTDMRRPYRYAVAALRQSLTHLPLLALAPPRSSSHAPLLSPSRSPPMPLQLEPLELPPSCARGCRCVELHLEPPESTCGRP
jgi:hypothetical protein